MGFDLLRSSAQRIPLYICAGLLFTFHPLFSQTFIADHTLAREEVLRSIPREYIDRARNELVLAYQHTSHGTHVSRGLYGLPGYRTGDDTLFAITRYTQESGKLFLMDERLELYPPGAKDLSAGDSTFVETTRNFLDAEENAHVNVVMWAWCDISDIDVTVNYLPGMEALISEYGPGGSRIGTASGQRELPVYFVFMTAHATANFNLGEGRPKNQAEIIINHCKANGRLCLDYYSIDTHDMDDNYWEDAGDNGNSLLYGGNFYQDFQDAHTVGDGYYENLSSPGGDVRFGTHTTQHITSNRKAYAMWWILARIAGWDGSFPVNAVEIATEGDTNQVVTGGELQLSGMVHPEHATVQGVSWSVINGNGTATISEAGLLRGGQPGMVRVVASAMDGSGATDTLDLTIAEAPVPLTQITVYAEEGIEEPAIGTSVQYVASTLPADATNPRVIWSVNNISGSALMDEDGMLSTQRAGIVEVVATAEDGSGITGILPVTIEAAAVMVQEISISTEGDVRAVDEGSTLQFTASVQPGNASNPALAWSVVEGSGSASIDGNGLLTALGEGEVDVVATAEDGSGVTAILPVTIEAAVVMVNDISIYADGNVSAIHEGSTLQFTASVWPENASNPALVWSVEQGSGSASISDNGLLTALGEGEVLVVATAQDGSGIRGTYAMTITGVTGLSEGEEGHMVLYPNPSSGMVYVNPGDLVIDRVEVLSVLGSLIHVKIPEPMDRLIELDLTDSQAGVFFVKAVSGNHTYVKRIYINK